MAAMDQRCRVIQPVLEEMLIGVVLDRGRHYAIGISDHAVGRNDDVAFDAKQSDDALLKYCEIAQQRENADNDDDHAHDLFGAAVDRQHVDQIENQNDDEESDQSANKKTHIILPEYSENTLPRSLA
jgi:hypothetical protein